MAWTATDTSSHLYWVLEDRESGQIGLSCIQALDEATQATATRDGLWKRYEWSAGEWNTSNIQAEGDTFPVKNGIDKTCTRRECSQAVIRASVRSLERVLSHQNECSVRRCTRSHLEDWSPGSIWRIYPCRRPPSPPRLGWTWTRVHVLTTPPCNS